eukprot:9479643-Pyramimonas_sp.AAC.1
MFDVCSLSTECHMGGRQSTPGLAGSSSRGMYAGGVEGGLEGPITRGEEAYTEGGDQSREAEGHVRAQLRVFYSTQGVDTDVRLP